jgi:hypothetical protein
MQIFVSLPIYMQDTHFELLEHLQGNDVWKTNGLVIDRQLSNSPPVVQAIRHQRLEELGYWKTK